MELHVTIGVPKRNLFSPSPRVPKKTTTWNKFGHEYASQVLSEVVGKGIAEEVAIRCKFLLVDRNDYDRVEWVQRAILCRLLTAVTRKFRA